MDLAGILTTCFAHYLTVCRSLGTLPLPTFTCKAGVVAAATSMGIQSRRCCCSNAEQGCDNAHTEVGGGGPTTKAHSIVSVLLV